MLRGGIDCHWVVGDDGVCHQRMLALALWRRKIAFDTKLSQYSFSGDV
jgi:hypothetical protein